MKRVVARGHVAVFCLFVAALPTGAGCITERENNKKLDLGVEPMAPPFASSAAYRDTIGSYTYYQGFRSMRVRGYGLVAGLGKGGSRDCPRHIHERLVQELYRRQGPSDGRLGVQTPTPESLIRDLETAVVVVEGDIPPAALRSSRFDVMVMALPGTQTASLRGGRLLLTDLEIFRAVSPTVAITGQALARAAGPVFINPFADDDSATRSNVLSGVVPGGGVVLQDRRVRLVLMEPSYQRAQVIQNRINARFPGERSVADAISPSFIRVTIPEEYRDDPGHFLALVRGLYLASDPAFQATRARMLAEEMTRPNASFASIALALEGLGRPAQAVLDDLYQHPEDAVSFHAAATGVNLGDHVALDVMTLHAQDAACPFRFPAIRALGGAKGMAGAGVALRNLLHDEDSRVRIEAYENLLMRGDASIESIPVGVDGFVMDLVDSVRPNIIYVKRTQSRRIALIGRDLRCEPPVLYRAPDGTLTIHADAHDEALTLLRVVKASGSVSPPIAGPTELAPLVKLIGSEAGVDYDERVIGLGLDYAAVVRALYHLCRDGSLNARFVLEQPNFAEIFGPRRQAGRPESEL